MKNAVFLITLCIALVAMSVSVYAGSGKRDMVPRVSYLSPDDDSVIDLTGKSNLTFRWKNSTTPGGGRDSFRFKLIKGFDYDFVVSENLGQGIFSIDIPADKLEDGATYSWYVEQRDASLMVWSWHDRWSFKVLKK